MKLDIDMDVWVITETTVNPDEPLEVENKVACNEQKARCMLSKMKGKFIEAEREAYCGDDFEEYINNANTLSISNDIYVCKHYIFEDGREKFFSIEKFIL